MSDRNRAAWLPLLLALTFVASGLLAQTEPAQVLERASAAYKAEGAVAFIAKLLESGPMAGNRDAAAQANMLRSVETYYGDYRGFEVVRTVDVSTSTRFVYAVFDYTTGPMFGFLTFYRGTEGWHVVNFNFHTEVHNVWPESMLVER